jgi:hypothetical protein
MLFDACLCKTLCPTQESLLVALLFCGILWPTCQLRFLKNIIDESSFCCRPLNFAVRRLTTQSFDMFGKRQSLVVLKSVCIFDENHH